MATPRLRPLAIALAAVLFAVAVPIGVSTGWPWRLGASGAGPDLPDTLLAVSWPPAERSPVAALTRRQVAVVEPTSGALRPLLEGAQQPLVAPDGRGLYFLRDREVGEALRTDVVALASDSLALQWTAEVSAQPLAEVAEQPYALGHTLAAAGDGLYVASFRAERADPVEILALDRASGRERARWTIDPSQAVGGVSLVAAEDGTSLYLLVVGRGVFGPSVAPPLTLVRLGLPDGREEARQRPASPSDAGAFVWNSRLTPDGRALYRVASDDARLVTRVDFLDLATATVERLEVAFSVSSQTEFPPQEWGLSPDGQRVYVLSPLSGELAIVDLVSRRVLQSATLDLPATAPRSEEGPFGGLWASLRGLLVSEALAKVPFSERLQVSPDGRRLYAIGARPERNGVRADGVWVIDTQAWRLAHHWLAGSEAWTVLLSADGRSLYVQDPPGGGAGSGALRVVDTATGGEVSRTDPLGNGQVSTVAELYRDRYGRSPRATDAARAAGTTFVPVAPMVVDVSPRQGVAGDAVTLEARFVDAAGRTVEPGQADVRFEPPAHVVAILSRGADPNDRQTVPLDPASYAIYQGSAILSAPDSWSPGSLSVQVIAEWPDGLRRRAFVRDAVVVQPAFVGSDRRRYVLRVTSEPDPPVAEQPALVRIAFVDAETGAPAADGPQPVADLPALKDATFFGDGGFTRQQLAEVGQGVYEGEVRLWSAGTWRVMATLGAPVDRTYTIGVLYTTAASR